MRVGDRILVAAVALTALVAVGRTGWHYLAQRQASLHYGSVPARRLSGEALSGGGQAGEAVELRLLGDYLAAATRAGDSALYVLSATSGELVGSLGARGDRPGQFRAPYSLLPAPDDPASLWIFDAGLRRLARVRLSEGRPALDPAPGSLITLQAEVPFTDPAWRADGGLIAPGAFPGGRFGLFDSDGGFEETTGTLPPNPRNLPAQAVQLVYLSRMQPRPGGSALAVAALFAGLLEIYRPDGTRADSAQVPFPFAPDYGVVEGEAGPVPAPTVDARQGYIDLEATARHIYGLFSGRSERSHPGRDAYAEYVHVFNWEGEFVEAFRLDGDAFAIAVDEAESTLYAARHRPEPAILRYALPGRDDAPPASR